MRATLGEGHTPLKDRASLQQAANRHPDRSLKVTELPLTLRQMVDAAC